MFKPFTNKYEFKNDVLIEDFPIFLSKPIKNWIRGVLSNHDKEYGHYLKSDYVDELRVTFREDFNSELDNFLSQVFSDPELLTNYLAHLLQNTAHQNEAEDLEEILSVGGSAYAVEFTEDGDDKGWTIHEQDLCLRVSEVVKKQSEEALTSNELLNSAWTQCYKHKPNYEKVVSNCCDVLEDLFKTKYYPSDTKPQITKFLKQFEQNPDILNYEGSTIVEPKNTLTNLLMQVANIRGQHTKGNGRQPTPEEARFVLHATIMIWNLHK